MRVYRKKMHPKAANQTHSLDCSKKTKKWYLKWERRIAAITGVIMFFALLVLVIYIIKDNPDEQKNDNKNFATRNMELFRSSLLNPCVCNDDNIMCEDIPPENLVSYIRNANCNWNVNTLQLENIMFTGPIEKNWLRNVSLIITTLIINSRYLEEIGDGAFENSTFPYLKQLSLSNTNLGVLRKETFLGSKIERLWIPYDAPHQLLLEANVFEHIAGTLQELQLQHCIYSVESLENATGTGATTKLIALDALDLRFNNLDVLRASSFSNVPVLTSLYLGYSNINGIEPKTFDGLKLKICDLSNNNLTTLPPALFKSKIETLSLEPNHWKCDCDLVWLRDYYTSNKYKVTDSFKCNTASGGVPYSQIEFCPSGGFNVSTYSTPNTNQISVTQFNSTFNFSTYVDYVNVSCGPRNFELLNMDSSILYAVLLLRRQTVQINVTQHSDENHFIIHVEGNITDEDVLMWMNSKNKEQRDCATNLDSVVISDLIPTETYTFCLIKRNRDSVSPFDCTGFTVPPKWKDKTWISNNYMVGTICGICSSILLALFISSLITFYCIRQHPSLIKGNKRVIIVESQAADAIVMPRHYYEAVNYIPPSLNSYSNGYLTPKYGPVGTGIGVPAIPEDSNLHHSSSASPSPPLEDSAAISVPIIASPGLPTLKENSAFVITSSFPHCKTRRSHRKKRGKLDHVTFDYHVYEAPPLPPNHPLGLKCDGLSGACSSA